MGSRRKTDINEVQISLLNERVHAPVRGRRQRTAVVFSGEMEEIRVT